MADEAVDAFVAQPLHIGAVRLVRALHAVTEIVQHFGDPAHADEMHRSNCPRHLHSRAASLNSDTVFLDAIASVRSASNRAASGWPADFADCAMAASLAGSLIRSPIRAASLSGDNVDCG